MGLSDAVKWATETADAGAKMVSEAISTAKDAVVKTAEAIVPSVSSTVKEAPKPASRETAVQGVNTQLTDKVAYAWQKTTEMTTTLGTYAAMLSPVAGGALAASKLISVGNNTYKNSENGDTVKILDKEKSVTSVLKDSAWRTAIKTAAANGENDGSPSIDTAKLIGGFAAAQGAQGEVNGDDKQETREDGRGRCKNEVTNNVNADQWKRILNDSSESSESNDCNGTVPEASVTGDQITFGPDAVKKAQQGEVRVRGDKTTHSDGRGNSVEFDAKREQFIALGANGTKVEVDRKSGDVEVTDNGKGYKVVDGKKVWDVNDGQTVELENGTYKVYDRSHNLVQQIEKDKVTDFRNGHKIFRFGGQRRIKEEYDRQRQQGADESGRVVGAAEDGVFMTDKDGTSVVLQTDGNAFFELAGGIKIWKNASNKYFVIEEGKAPQEILDGEESKRVQAQAEQYLDLLKGWANNNTFTRDGVKFTNVDGKIELEMDDGKTSLQAGPKGLVLKAENAPISTVDTLTNKLTIGEGKDQTTIDPDKEIVDTPWVITDKSGTTIKSSGDWVGHDLEVKMADGTHYTQEGDVRFSDGTVFYKSGEITVGSGARLAADIQEQQIKQAASVLRNAEAIADTVKAKASSGLVTYDMIAQLEGSITQINTLMQMFSGNDAVRARLGMVLASLESARNDAKSSFASNTALRATRDAALTSNKVSPQSILFNSGYSPELKMQFRFDKINKSAA